MQNGLFRRPICSQTKVLQRENNESALMKQTVDDLGAHLWI